MTDLAAPPAFQFDLKGRIRNLSLPASNVNALIPLFEAVSNSIHAIEVRFGEKDAPKSGSISIRILRSGEEESHVVGFSIRDNGVGLTDPNMGSFCTSDSEFKKERGGKGIGRLSWLKAFQSCRVESKFANGENAVKRQFDFTLDGGTNPIKNHAVTPAPDADNLGTTILLRPFYSAYEVRCPKKMTTIAQKLVGHFLPYLVVDKLPYVELIDADENSVDLRRYFSEHQKRNQIDTITLRPDLLEDEVQFHVYQIMLRKELKFLETGGNHWMFYGGNERVVRQEAIDGLLGLKYVGDESDCVYVGLVMSEFLDSHVNQERTGFSITDEQFTAIHKAAVDSAKGFLSEYIDRVREQQLRTAGNIIRENPQFITFKDNLGEFVGELSLNTQREEDILLEFSRARFRSKRKLEGEIRSLKADGAEDLGERVKQITEALNAIKVSSLAEYVVRRKEILELFDSSLAFKEPENRRYFREEIIHDLICPLRSSSDDLDYDDHNLWILDDRLAFYTFFKSDMPFSSFVEGSDSGREPDVALMFDRALAFQREGRDEPVIIIEFKRPGRDNYDMNNSPVVQVLDYVDEFRSGTSVTDYKGRMVKPISDSTRFICYVVADFTDTLLRVIRSSPANHATADGEGFFGYSQPHNAFVEVMPYSKVIRDARIRNEAFFERLGLV